MHYRGIGANGQGRRASIVALLVAGLTAAWLLALGTVAHAQGVTGYQEPTKTISIGAGSTGNAPVSCPTGDVVVGGGFQVQDPSTDFVLASQPALNGALSNNTWEITVESTAKTSQNVTVTAVCVSQSSVPGYEEQTNSAVIGGVSSSSVTANCSSGNEVVGGGFSNQAGVLEVSSQPESSSNISSTLWTSDVTNNNDGSVSAAVTAICVSSSISGYEEQFKQDNNVPASSTTPESVSCSTGELLLGGGTQVESPSIDKLGSSQPASGGSVSNTWSASVTNTSATVQEASVIAICASPVPTVSAVKPRSGPAAGGTHVTIVGTGFTGATAVDFGGNVATSFTVDSDSQITATSPAGSGSVGVTVTTPAGTSAPNPSETFNYVPSVTRISPSSGPAAGGTSVTITGTGFSGATAVHFGGTAVTSFKVNSATSITATSPAGADVVDITVTTPGGTSTASSVDKFHYVPSVTRISPSSGPAAGGTSVTITGTGFTGATAVGFGGTAATSFKVNSATSITATSPAGSGSVDVTATTPGGTSTASSVDKFNYIPSVTRISPSSGPAAGGTSVTITGTGFTGATAVHFGGTPATSFKVNSATSITATSPAGADVVDVAVTTPGGTSTASSVDKFHYVPSVTKISPSSGPAAGGTTVTITGTGLTGATAVHFGGTAAPSFNVVSSTKITATSPAGSGAVDVTVTTPGGTSATNASDKFHYVPSVSSISPTSGPGAGGTSVTITGTGFAGATALHFGGTAATSFTVNSATKITATSPAGSGAVDVTVTTPGGTSAPNAADKFDYVPAVTSVGPTSGPGAGGTSVTITGTGLTGATTVHFGGTAAPSFNVVSSTKITATSPAGSGAVDVTVTTPGGTSAANAADEYSYDTAPSMTPGVPSVTGTTSAAFSATVNPEGLATSVVFEYGPALPAARDVQHVLARASLPFSYSSSTAAQTVGPDFVNHTVTATVTGLLPNTTYHVRVVATNSAGSTTGPDQTLNTPADPPPPPPVLGKSVDAGVVSGLVLVKLPGNKPLYAADAGAHAASTLTKGTGFVPLTEPRQLPVGTQVDARLGTISLKAAASTKHGKLQTGTFNGGLFKLSQDRKGLNKGLTTLSLLEGLFPGAPSYASCKAKKAGDASPFASAASSTVLQALHASAHGKFRTRGRYSAATVRGTVWGERDRCDGSLTIVRRGTVQVTDFVRHITVVVRAGHSYLARAPSTRRG